MHLGVVCKGSSLCKCRCLGWGQDIVWGAAPLRSAYEPGQAHACGDAGHSPRHRLLFPAAKPRRNAHLEQHVRAEQRLRAVGTLGPRRGDAAQQVSPCAGRVVARRLGRVVPFVAVVVAGAAAEALVAFGLRLPVEAVPRDAVGEAGCRGWGRRRGAGSGVQGRRGAEGVRGARRDEAPHDARSGEAGGDGRVAVALFVCSDPWKPPCHKRLDLGRLCGPRPAGGAGWPPTRERPTLALGRARAHQILRMCSWHAVRIMEIRPSRNSSCGWGGIVGGRGVGHMLRVEQGLQRARGWLQAAPHQAAVGGRLVDRLQWAAMCERCPPA